jgi:competence protein ComEA
MRSQGTWGFAAVLAALLPALAFAGPVNVNTADAATLARELQGIGMGKAEAIVAHRDKHGPFRSVDDLARVKGIGRKTLDRNRDFIRLDGRPAPRAGAGASAAASATAPAPRAGVAAPKPGTAGSASRNR